MRATLTIIVMTAAVGLGCQQVPLPDVREDAQGVVDGARTRANELRELSAEELRDISAIEYRSFEIESGDLAQMDDLLNELGQERWECYHVSENSRGRVFYFKRNRSNVIAHLTNLLRLGAIAF